MLSFVSQLYHVRSQVLNRLEVRYGEGKHTVLATPGQVKNFYKAS